jgi:hypothetical protein
MICHGNEGPDEILEFRQAEVIAVWEDRPSFFILLQCIWHALVKVVGLPLVI